MEENNKRIAKNTLYLYLRQLIIMVLGFFTTRIVLEKLGASDYGVNNVVAGFVSMFTLLNSVMQTGTRRFIALQIGRGEAALLRQTFSTATVIHLLVGLLVVLLLESFGLWFLNSELNIPIERMGAARWVFHLSVIGVFLGITQTPYTAAITAHERFDVFAALSIFDVFAKLAVLFLLVYIPGDKLIIYATLQTLVGLASISIARGYCIKNFSECKLSLSVNKSMFREMAVFSGWSVVGNLSATLNGHGRSILLNIFFNTIVNAAVGLASTVTFTISQFVSGFITAATPQLTKYYGAGDMERFHRLIFNVTQYTIFLLAFIGVPVIMEIDYVLKLWLTEVPPYTADFIRITLVVSFINYSNMFADQGCIAIGRVREQALYCQPLYLLTLPLIYIVLKMGCSPTVAFMVGAIPSSLAFVATLGILKKFADFPARNFFTHIFLRNILLVSLSCLPPLLIQSLMEQSLWRFLVVSAVAVASTSSLLYTFALNEHSRLLLRQKAKGLLGKRS